MLAARGDASARWADSRSVTVHDGEPWGPSERLRDPRTAGIAFLAACAAATATLFSRGGPFIHILGVLVIAALSVVITTRSLARWRDKRFQPIFGALICAGWGVVILGVALWIKIA
jgi:ABC-type Fe3+-siderophore transport system permease subunit